jgi:hypothetical protein
MGHTGQRVAPAGKIEPQINADEDWPSSAALEIVASGPRAGASGLHYVLNRVERAHLASAPRLLKNQSGHHKPYRRHALKSPSLVTRVCTQCERGCGDPQIVFIK